MTEPNWKYSYSISQEICTWFLLCCALLWLYIDWFSHIHQAFFTGTVAIERLPKCQQCNPDEYGEILHVNSLWTIAQQQQSKAQQNRVHISWDILYNPTGDCSRGTQQRQKCSHGRVVVVVYFYSAYRFEAWIINLSSFRWLNISIYVYTCIYIYIYIKWTVFVNVTTKSAQHAHARMIAIIVEKSPKLKSYVRPWFHG